MRLYTLILAVVTLTGCAARTPIPDPELNCAAPINEEQTDGGYGGTGNAPEECPPAQ